MYFLREGKLPLIIFTYRHGGGKVGDNTFTTLISTHQISGALLIWSGTKTALMTIAAIGMTNWVFDNPLSFSKIHLTSAQVKAVSWMSTRRDALPLPLDCGTVSVIPPVTWSYLWSTGQQWPSLGLYCCSSFHSVNQGILSVAEYIYFNCALQVGNSHRLHSGFSWSHSWVVPTQTLIIWLP